MKSEADHITDEECVLRRVHKDRFKTDRVPIISPSAFEPRVGGRDPDDDGISFYREECLSSPEDVLQTVAEEKQRDIGVIRIPVRVLRELGLRVESRPGSRIAGHVVIPELNARDYAAAKSRFTPLLLDLATIASHDDNIILSPGRP